MHIYLRVTLHKSQFIFSWHGFERRQRFSAERGYSGYDGKACGTSPEVRVRVICDRLRVRNANVLRKWFENNSIDQAGDIVSSSRNIPTIFFLYLIQVMSARNLLVYRLATFYWLFDRVGQN